MFLSHENSENFVHKSTPLALFLNEIHNELTIRIVNRCEQLAIKITGLSKQGVSLGRKPTVECGHTPLLSVDLLTGFRIPAVHTTVDLSRRNGCGFGLRQLFRPVHALLWAAVGAGAVELGVLRGLAEDQQHRHD